MQTTKPKIINYKIQDLELNDPGPTEAEYIKSTADGISVICDMPLVWNEIYAKPYRISFMSIYLVTQGKMTITRDKIEYSAKKNDLIISRPNAVKQLVGFEPGTRVSRIRYTADFLSKATRANHLFNSLEFFFTQSAALWNLDQNDATLISRSMEHLYSRIIGAKNHSFGHELLDHTFCIFYYELAELSKKYKVPQKVHMSHKVDLVMCFINLVQENFRLYRNVSFYAEQLHVSSKYISEVVSEITGKSPHEIIGNFVTVEAKLFLDDPALTISQITDSLNFSDQSFFGKYFKRNTGISPNEYRNQQ